MSVDGVLAWLSGLPAGALYATLAAVAALENVFPPFPADTVVAFGSFLAARGRASPVAALAATLLGNLAGAAAMYVAGRRLGSRLLRSRLFQDETGEREARFRAMYERFGLPALFVSRFVPGVRAIVPPLAGALGVSAPAALATMGLASAIWYGFITIVCYRVGSEWDQVAATIGRYGRIIGIAATVLAVAAGVAWYVRRRRAR